MLVDFIRCADEIVQYDAYFTLLSIDEHSVHSLDIERTELLSLWSALKVEYDNLLKSLKPRGASPSDSIAEVKVKYREVYRTYVRCLSSINGLIEIKQKGHDDNRSNVQISGTSNSNSTTQNSNSNIHVPPCDTDIFHGDYVTWPSFRDMFTALYINNHRLSNVVKLYHLRQKTTGEARDIVSNAPLTNDGLSVAWDNLRDRFENKRIFFNAQMKLLLNLPTVSKESGVEIKSLQRTINGCINALKHMDIDVDGWDPIFVFLCSSRLPNATLDLWEQSLETKIDIPQWKDLDLFLSNRFQTLESVSDIRQSNSNGKKQFSKSQEPHRIEGKSHLKSLHTSVAQSSCPLCKEDHTIRTCPKFLKMSVEDRSDTVRKQKLCYNCLAPSHHVRHCKSKYRCSVCKYRHNSLLHQVSHGTSNNRKNSPTSTFKALPNHGEVGVSDQQAPIPTSQSFVTSVDERLKTSVLLGTAIVQVCIGNICHNARALIDSGSEASFVSERLQQALQLQTRRVDAQITGLNEAVTAKSTKVCLMKIKSSKDVSFEIEFEAYVIRSLTGHLPVLNSAGNSLNSLELADRNSSANSKIDLVLGGNLYPMIIQDGIRKDMDNSLLAQNTVFGWIITGILREPNTTPTLHSFFNAVSLEKCITRFWQVEEPPRVSTMSQTDKYCEEYFKRTIYRNNTGRFVVSLPFKPEFGKTQFLGPSRHLALAQYMRNESRLLQNPLRKTSYDSVITEYKTLNHMSLVKPDDVQSTANNFYLPHHAVVKPSSTTTKLRVVFNASSQSSNGKSLNDMLYAGPVLQNDLIILILRWRLFKYVFNADIEKMYRQILVNPQHTPYQRILFRPSPAENLGDYELNTVTFGVNCAPYLAIRTLLELAQENEKTHPVAAWMLRKCMYVDDLLAGAHTLEDGYQARDEIISVLQSAGFPLRKWASNTQELLKGIPQDYLLDAQFLHLSDKSTTKTLGLKWNAGSDYFYFDPLPLNSFTTRITKRIVLSDIAKLFDPAGWLAPLIIVAKIIMQSIWLENIDWDDILPPLVMKQWKEFLSDYPNINSIKIPRWLNFSVDSSVQLHGFCDASEKAYAAVLYLRVHNSKGEIHVNLLTSKTRVAPIAKRSLPRLELCGAELLARLVSSVIPQLDISLNQTFLWTDSTIVISWLRKPPCNWSTFVGNRVSAIAEMVGTENWNHVVSHDNPADVASRGIKTTALQTHSLWWHGPSWLHLEEAKWPRPLLQDTFDTDLEVRKAKSFFSNVRNEVDVLDHFSSYSTSVKVVSYIYRFFHACHPKIKGKYTFPSLVLSTEEIHFARDKLIILAQKRFFPIEYKLLLDNKPLNKNSEILSLTPFMDTNHILRVNGRLAHSQSLTYNEKFPVILPYSARLTQLLMEFIHRISIHGEISLMMRIIRTEFWVPRLKNLVKKTIHSCKVCIIYKQKQTHQVMAALPLERTSFDRPFTKTGIDFAGPFEIKSYTGRRYNLTKGYVLVFVCFVTKAIHLEATSDMSTKVFLAAFARFFSRRGCPSVIFSDNGTSFVGASRILKQEYAKVMLTVQHNLTNQQILQEIDWRFIPPGAPHMGGLWEAGVKSFKTHLKKISCGQKYTFEEFSTLLSRIEACLNSRPISPQSEDPNDLTALTPGHFLIGGPILAPSEIDISRAPISLVNRWEKLKRLHLHFAQRWKDEYLKEQHRRYKWQYPQKNVAIGDLVVVRQENLPPTQWLLGRVETVHTGKDSNVRVLDIKTAKGIITRPIVKVVVLPIKTN